MNKGQAMTTAVVLSTVLMGTLICNRQSVQADTVKREYKVQKSESEWKEQLGEHAFEILRQKGTERPFTGKYNDFKEKGVFVCAGCGQELFSSDTKFNSGTGWPSFYQPVKEGHVDEEKDSSYGMVRTEILCSRCGGHLGHVFNDGPDPTGLRYCVNSASLDFKNK